VTQGREMEQPQGNASRTCCIFLIMLHFHRYWSRIFSIDIENATSGKWSIIRELEQVREMKHNQGNGA